MGEAPSVCIAIAIDEGGERGWVRAVSNVRTEDFARRLGPGPRANSLEGCILGGWRERALGIGLSLGLLLGSIVGDCQRWQFCFL